MNPPARAAVSSSLWLCEGDCMPKILRVIARIVYSHSRSASDDARNLDTSAEIRVAEAAPANGGDSLDATAHILTWEP